MENRRDRSALPSTIVWLLALFTIVLVLLATSSRAGMSTILGQAAEMTDIAAHLSLSNSNESCTCAAEHPCADPGTNDSPRKEVDIAPRFVHFVLYNKPDLAFFEYIAMRSVRLYVNPEALYVHSDVDLAKGTGFWQQAISDLDLTIMRGVIDPVTIAGMNVSFPTHKTDLLRLITLTVYGGLYLDTDVWLMPRAASLFHDFAPYPVVMGCEDMPECKYMTNAAVLARPGAEFLRRWYEQFSTDYRPEQYSYNAVHATKRIQEAHPHSIHTVNTTWMFPAYGMMKPFFKPGPANETLADYPYDFSQNYMIHWWHRAEKESLHALKVADFEGKKLDELSEFQRLAKAIYESELPPVP